MLANTRACSRRPFIDYSAIIRHISRDKAQPAYRRLLHGAVRQGIDAVNPAVAAPYPAATTLPFRGLLTCALDSSHTEDVIARRCRDHVGKWPFEARLELGGFEIELQIDNPVESPASIEDVRCRRPRLPAMRVYLVHVPVCAGQVGNMPTP